MVKPWVVVETDCTAAALALCNKILNRHKLRPESCLHTTYILKFYLLSAHTDRYYFLSYLSTSSSFPYITFEPLSLITLFCEYSSYFTTFELPTPITSGKKFWDNSFTFSARSRTTIKRAMTCTHNTVITGPSTSTSSLQASSYVPVGSKLHTVARVFSIRSLFTMADCSIKPTAIVQAETRSYTWSEYCMM